MVPHFEVSSVAYCPRFGSGVCFRVFLASLGTVSSVTLIAPNCMAQAVAGGRGGQPHGPLVRIEAAAYVRWNPPARVVSPGDRTYWLRVSTAYGNGKTTGGFMLDSDPRLLGKISSIVINGKEAGHTESNSPPPPGKPSVAKLRGTCRYQGKPYDVEIDLVGDLWKPSSAPGGKGGSVRGSILLKLNELRTHALSEAVSVKQSSVSISLR